ncbi:MAG: GntR family transcriptional regulator [Steroidobacteraceae bacterium]
MVNARARTGWQAVRDEVLRRIETRRWLPGMAIPTEAELAGELHCARTTVNRALRELARSGVLERRRKAGSRVALHPVRRAMLDIPLLRHEVAAIGAAYGYRLLARQTLPANRIIARQLDLAQGAPLLRLRALHLANGRPYVYEDRWIDPRVTPAATEVDFAGISANEWLIANAPLSTGKLAIAAVPAPPAAARALGCKRSAPLLLLRRTTWLGDRAVTCVDMYYTPNHQLQSEF